MPIDLMSSPPLAILHSSCGELHIFDADALAKVVMSLPSVAVHTAAVKTIETCTAKPLLHDGFTIEQWGSFGKRKSKIASSVCKENGFLKKRLLGKSEGDTEADPLFQSDPWQAARAAGCCETETVASSTFSSPGGQSGEDRWSKWPKKSASTCSRSSRTGVPCEAGLTDTGEPNQASIDQLKAELEAYRANMQENTQKILYEKRQPLEADC